MAGSPQKRARKIEAGEPVAPEGDKPPQGTSFAPALYGNGMAAANFVPLTTSEQNAAGELLRSAFATLVQHELPTIIGNIANGLHDPEISAETRAKFALALVDRADKLRVLEPVIAEAQIVATEYVDSE
jgi:hypothetical protein